MATDLRIINAAKELRTRKGKVDDAIESATGRKKVTSKKPSARKKKAVPLSEIKKTKHKGSEGETSYGQRIKAPVMGKTKTRFNQSENGDY